MSVGEILLHKNTLGPRPSWWIPEGMLFCGESLEKAAKRVAEEALECAIVATLIRGQSVAARARFEHCGTYLHYWGSNGDAEHLTCWVMGLEITTSERRALKLNGHHEWMVIENVSGQKKTKEAAIYDPALVKIAQDARDWRIHTRHS